MSIYEGSRIEREYAHGRDEGRRWCEADLSQGETTYWLSTLTDEANTFRHVGHRSVRAFYVGALRGYRETLQGSRYGV